MIDLSRAECFALCHTCHLRHPCFSHQGYLDFCERHKGHATSLLNRDWLHEQHRSKLAAWDPRKLLVSAFGYWDTLRLRVALEGYDPNADVKQARQALQTMTVTALQSLASSPTASWQSAEVDNSSNLYLFAIVQCVLDFANTAPANSKGVYWWVASGAETGKLSNPFSGSEGTLTLADVTSFPQNARPLGFQPYTTQDEVSESSVMPVEACFDGMLPLFWSVGGTNHSGAALHNASTVKQQGGWASIN